MSIVAVAARNSQGAVHAGGGALAQAQARAGLSAREGPEFSMVGRNEKTRLRRVLSSNIRRRGLLLCIRMTFCWSGIVPGFPGWETVVSLITADIGNGSI